MKCEDRGGVHYGFGSRRERVEPSPRLFHRLAFIIKRSQVPYFADPIGRSDYN